MRIVVDVLRVCIGGMNMGMNNIGGGITPISSSNDKNDSIDEEFEESKDE